MTPITAQRLDAIVDRQGTEIAGSTGATTQGHPMSNLTSTARERQSDQHQHQHPPSRTLPPPSRVGLVDRLALRLGLALITWSRRSRTPESWERRATRIEQQLGRETRERAALQLALRTAPPR